MTRLEYHELEEIKGCNKPDRDKITLWYKPKDTNKVLVRDYEFDGNIIIRCNFRSYQYNILLTC